MLVLAIFILSFVIGRLDGVKFDCGKISVINSKTGNKHKFYQKKW